MIVLDAQDRQLEKRDSFVAGSTVRPPERVTVAGRSSSLLLPDYETSQAIHSEISRPSLQTSPLPSKSRFKFWRATLYALAIYIALSVVIAVPLIVTRSRKRPEFAPLPWDINSVTSSSSLSITKSGLSVDGGAALCDRYYAVDEFDDVDSLYHSLASHTLPPSGSFLIRSNLTLSGDPPEGFNGRLDVDINPDPTEEDVVIAVSVVASSPRLRQRSHVCFCEEGKCRGLSLYVPDDLRPTDTLSFSISVLLPQSPTPLSLECFRTELESFSQSFGDLSEHISFSVVDLRGSCGDIFCNSLQARSINIKNSVASITGSFNISEALGLDTVEGPILANITLVHEPSRDPPTFIYLDTGNSRIQANITLFSPGVHTRSGPPSFAGSIKTFNAPLIVDIAYDPSTVSLPFDLYMQNNQGETNITTDAKFSSFFDLQTKLAPVHVNKGKDDPVADPTGQNRLRQLYFDPNTPTKRRGWIGWGSRPRDWNPRQYGNLEVISSLSPVHLQLGPKSS